MSKAAEMIKIVGLCVASSMVYGIVHDQITARIYLPYFTVYHPHIVDSTDPTVIALVWGVIATWWVGLVLSIPLSFTAVLGDQPVVPFRRSVKAVAVLLLAMAVCAATVGLTSYYTGSMIPEWAARTPDKFGGPHGLRLFSAVLATHQTSYGVGAVGALGLCVWASIVRQKLAENRPPIL